MNQRFKKDTLYCGVREDKISTAKPKLRPEIVKEWFYHQRERTNIYYLKEIQRSPYPWTLDPILNKYKFVNTKRTWDRQTKWLLKNVINNPNIDYRSKILNCVLFRVINKGETFDLWNGAINFSQLSLEDIDSLYRKLLVRKAKTDPKYVFFSAAYILGGPKVNFGKFIADIEGEVEPNMVIRTLKFLYYHQDSIHKGIQAAKNQQEIYRHLLSFSGLGSFLAYQIFVDLTYIKEFDFTEHHFVIAFPGCKRGINWLFEDKDGMTDEECLFWFTENQFKIADEHNEEWNMNKLFGFLDKKERKYTLMDMENSGACELDKRCRTIFNGKRPKQLYNKATL